ncbi:hypothetical protein PHYBOEH_006005 [Phytophthora boehmeriae]|uniref:MtN3-like protein n=1 Tax=Phytophthora boehmeriae TaxID=109152 RepID=A0A8T1WQ08_9STRA|nr:hypothetical protein PHYBOEH_006005 [Phytophthora boehmeriae]
MMYGALTEIWFPVFSCFLFGEVCAIIFLSVYTYYATDKCYVIRVLAVFLSVLAVVTIYAIVGGLGYTGQITRQVSTIVGIMADIAGIFLYGAPMEKLLPVLKHKSAVFINVHMVIAGLVNNSIWLVYGILITNWFIMFINVLFVVVNTFTLCLYRVYDPKTHPLKDGWDAHLVDTDDRISVSIEMAPHLESVSTKKVIASLPSPEFSALTSPILQM